jgi:hypothetical protein
MGRNIKWVHAPPHEAASPWLPDEYSLPARLGTPRASFAIGESLTLYEAARIISGRHPYPLSPDGVTTLGPHMGLISAGSTSLTRRRHRPLRAKAAFEALRQKVESGKIHAEEIPRLSLPGTIFDGGIDWLNVKVATADVVRLCEEQGWRCGLLREPITTSAPLVGKSLAKIAAKKKSREKGTPCKPSPDAIKVPRHCPQIESARLAIRELYHGVIPSQTAKPNAVLFREVGAKIKVAGRPVVSDDTILRASCRRK